MDSMMLNNLPLIQHAEFTDDIQRELWDELMICKTVEATESVFKKQKSEVVLAEKAVQETANQLKEKRNKTTKKKTQSRLESDELLALAARTSCTKTMGDLKQEQARLKTQEEKVSGMVSKHCRRLLLTCHPDRLGSNFTNEHQAKFARIKEASAVFGVAGLRIQYLKEMVGVVEWSLKENAPKMVNVPASTGFTFTILFVLLRWIIVTTYGWKMLENEE